ncbi:MAG: TIGR03749 family integrating conjugative element protein [Gammaproteobacteria bacterium]
MRFVLSVMLFFCLGVTGYADSLSSLTLTDAEMQKLKKYFPTDDTSHLTWKGDPISIALPVNKEKRVVFPNSVSVDVKNALTADQLRILNNDKSLYLTALKPFQTTRIYVTLKENGEVILIDLTTNENALNETQQIDIKQNSTTATISETSSQVLENKPFNDDIGFSDLIRFAWQETYAPTRLIQNSSIFTRAPMHTEKFVSDLVYGDKVIAYPESSWISNNHYVTAVLLRNKYPHKTHVDIQKDLCGDWQAGSIYPTTNLEPYGNKQGDSVMLFLVSSRPFGEMTGVCHGDA